MIRRQGRHHAGRDGGGSQHQKLAPADAVVEGRRVIFRWMDFPGAERKIDGDLTARRLRRRRLRFQVEAAPAVRRHAFPTLKGAEERIAVVKAQQVSDLVMFHSLLRQVLVCLFPAGFLDELLKGDAQAVEARTQTTRPWSPEFSLAAASLRATRRGAAPPFPGCLVL